jgi:hypothetical protein
MLRFLYLNIYSFLIVFAGILTLLAPFYLITKWLFIIQIIISIPIFSSAIKLFSAWESKKKELDILVNRNQDNFRPDTFDLFMQAPCGRLLVKQALKDLNKKEEYKYLLKLQKPLFERLRENCTPKKTVIYINEDVL